MPRVTAVSEPKFGEIVRANLDRLGMTLRDLETKTGVAYRTLRKVIASNKLLAPEECALIENAVGLKEGTAHAMDRAHLRSIARRWGNGRRQEGAAVVRRAHGGTRVSPTQQSPAEGAR